jgi:hypothetical protein
MRDVKAWGDHSNRECGLHVHVNRAWFGDSEDAQDLALAKVVILTDTLWDELYKLSRRTREDINWAKRNSIDIRPFDRPRDIVEKTKRASWYDRQLAWNLSNTHTAEFRLGKGTTDYHQLVAWLELTDLLTSYAKRRSLQAVQEVTWAEFKRSIRSTHLKQYVAERGL